VASLGWALALGRKPFSAFLDHDPESSAAVLSLSNSVDSVGWKAFQ
jgi:hypothetical protein